MAMSALRKGASGGLGKILLFGILAMAAGGLVLTDAGGFFRDGVGGSDIAKAGDYTLSLQEFDRDMRRAIQPLNITPEQAAQMGYLRQILNNRIRTDLMATAAKDHDLELSRPMIAQEIHAMVSPMVQEGQTAEDVLNQLLTAQRMSERELISNVNKDVSVNLLGQALQAGFATTSDALANDLHAYMNETRSITVLSFPDSQFDDIAEPSEEDLQNLYAASRENYAIPETRTGRVILIATDELQETMDISDDDIRAEYDANIQNYTLPEMRTVSQSILRTNEQAQKVADATKSGKDLKDAVKEVTGNTTDFIPARAIDKEGLLEDLQEPVYSANEGDIIGPVETPLGFQVLKIESIETAHTVTFEDAREDIRKELAILRLSDLKYDTANMVDDLLASGMSPDEIKQQMNVTIVEIPATSISGSTAENTQFPESLSQDKGSVVEALYSLEDGQSSPVFETTVGNMAAVYLDKITPKAYQEFESVKEQLSTQWVAQQKRDANRQYVENILKENTDFNSIIQATGKRPNRIEAVTRDPSEGSALTPAAVEVIFNTRPADMALVELESGPAIVKVVGYNLPNSDNEDLKAVRESIMQASQNEAIMLYFDHLSKKYKAQVNERLLQQAYSNPPQQR